MAIAKFLFQAVKDETHVEAVQWVLEGRPEEILFSVAFARAQGVGFFVNELTENSRNVECFVGVRNNITSYQALEVLLRAGVRLYAVDTGSRTVIFHPKIYFSRAGRSGRAVIGSSNMTFGGLRNNIEASAVLELDERNGEDRAFLSDVYEGFEYLKDAFKEHVVELETIDDLDEMLADGRLVDETIPSTAPEQTRGVARSDSVPLMELYSYVPVPTVKRGRPGALVDSVQLTGSSVIVPRPQRSDYYLVWQSNALSKRDLNVPSGSTTNKTGSMLWKKGAVEGIDQRHYFRDDVFGQVEWEQDPRLEHYERAYVVFHIFTKGVYNGAYTLRVSHNNDVNSRSYEQNNSMTSVSWGAAIDIVARRDLLGRTMSLYRKDTDPPEYMIEID